MNELYIGLSGACFGIVSWLAMPVAQEIDKINDRIPDRSPNFLHMRDFWTTGWADLTALSLIDVAVALRFFREDLPLWTIVLTATVGIIGGILLTRWFYAGAIRPRRKIEDWGFLKRESDGMWIPTLGGRAHLGYFLAQASIAFMGLVLLFSLNMRGIPLTIGLISAAFYGVAWARDFRCGLSARKK